MVNIGSFLFDVTCTEPLNDAVIIAAIYNSNNELVSISIKQANGETEYYINMPSNESADHAKILVWEELDSARPRAVYEEILSL